MSPFSRRLIGRVRALVIASLSGVIVYACTEGPGVTDGIGRQVPINLLPNLQVGPSPFTSPPIDLIRLRAIDVATMEVVGSSEEVVDPAAGQWALSLGVDLGGAASVEVIVEIELLSGQTVEWSGRTSPFTVEPGLATQARAVDVFRGPLDNLDVIGVAIQVPPAQLLAGTSATLDASVTLEPGSTASPILYWTTLNAGVATVTSQGTSVTLTAGTPGTTSVLAGAGRETDQFSIEVLPRVSSVVVSPDPVQVIGTAVLTQFSAAVTDGLGNPDPTAPVTWGSTSTGVATVDATGLATSVGFGTTQVQATSFGVTGSADLTVRGPDIVPAAFTVVPDGPGGILSLADTEFHVDVENVGLANAGPTALEIRILDAADQSVAHPALSFAIPALNAGQTHSVQELGGAQIQQVQLPTSLLFEAVVDASGAVAEEDEANNTGAIGPIAVLPPIPPGSKLWVGGDAGGMIDWSNANNWSPPGVPTASDDVLIDNATFEPQLSADVSVRDLTVVGSPTIDLDGFTLTVNGDLDGDAVASLTAANGTVVLDGAGTLVDGAFDELRVNTSRALNGLVEVNLDLTIDADLDVSVFTLTVGDDLWIDANGRLIMDEINSTVQVASDVSFAGRSHEGFLTAGTLVLSGDFFAADTDPASFAPSGTHLTLFNGSVQTALFDIPGTTASRFHALAVGPQSGLNLQGNAFATDQVTVLGALTVNMNVTLAISGALTLGLGSTLDVDGTVTATGGCVDNGATITGTGSHPCGSPQFSKVWQGGAAGGATDWGNANNWQPAGVPINTDDVLVDVANNQPVLSADATVASLQVSGTSTVDLGGNTLTVGGSLVAGAGITNGLVSLTASGALLHGTVDDLEVATSRAITGNLELTGDLTLTSGNLNLNGQPVSVAGDLLVQGTGVLNMTTAGASIDVVGDVTFDSQSHSGWLSQGTLTVGGSFTATASSPFGFVGTGSHTVVFDATQARTLTLATPGTNQQRFAHVTFQGSAPVTALSDLVASGTMTLQSGASVDASGRVVRLAGGLVDPDDALDELQLRLYGDVSALPNTLTAELYIDATVRLPNNVALTGSLYTTQYFELDGNQMTVSGNVDVSGGSGRVAMVDAGDLLDVEGDVVYDGANTTGYLTTGTLFIAGDLTAGSTVSTASFRATGGHTTTFDGGGPQTITFASPGTSSVTQEFSNVTITNSSAVTMASDLVAFGAITVDAGSTVDVTGQVVRVAGSYTDPNNGLSVPELHLYGDVSALPTTLTTDLFVDATVRLPNGLDLTGSLFASQYFELDGNQMSVSGDVEVSGGSGRVAMVDVGDVLDVEGNVVYDGASTNGYLTTGTLFIAGDLIAANTVSTASFRATGTHTTTFDGGGPQLITFSNPGITSVTQEFRNVTVTNNSAVTMTSDLVAFGAITVDAGSTADATGQVVRVAGSYTDANNGLTVPELHLYGDVTALPASLTTDLYIDATVLLPGTLDLTGSLFASAYFELDGNQMTVTGNVTVSGGSGRVAMVDVGDLLDVEGDVVYDGASTNGYLTQGTLFIGGDLTAGNTVSAASFRPSSNHTTEFDGGVPQTITLSDPGTSSVNQEFRNLTVTNGTDVTLGGDLVVSGTLSVVPGSTVDALTRVVRVAGSYTDPADGMAVSELRLYGSVTALPATLNTELYIDATVLLPNTVALTGNLYTTQYFELDGNQMSVSGDVEVSGGSGRVAMVDPGDVLDVEGNVVYDGASTNGYLTEGTLFIAGDLIAANTVSTASFRATGTHTTTFDGGGPQLITFSNPGITSVTQEFRNVTFFNTAATLASDMTVSGALVVTGFSTADATGQVVRVAGSYTDANNGLTVPELHLYGDVTALPASLTTDLYIDATVLLPGTLDLTGSLFASAYFELDGNQMTVTGNVTVSGGSGRVAMVDVGDLLDVEGDVVYDGASTSGYLTQGTLFIGGDLTAGNTVSAASFRPSSNHTTEFDGGLPQTITLSDPGTSSANQEFRNLTVTNGTDVTLGSDLVVSGTLSVVPGSTVDALTRVVRVAGSYTDPADGMAVSELRLYGSVTALPATLNTELYIDATVLLPNTVALTGNLYTTQYFELDGNQMSVSGSVDVSGASGRVAMIDPGDALTVGTDVSYDGASMNGYLTIGTLRIGGDLTVGSTNTTQAFLASGVHTTLFDGSGVQTVSFDDPGFSTQRFMNLTVENFSGSVSLASTAVVAGTFTADDVTLDRSGPLGTLLDVRGVLDVQVTTFVGLPLQLISSTGPTGQLLTDVEFQSMDPTDTQLILRMPGASAGAPSLTPQNMIFDQVLTTGYYVDASSTNAQPWRLEMDNPIPGSASPPNYLTDGIALIIWPWP